jgi:pheromone shutdown protein TraB
MILKKSWNLFLREKKDRYKMETVNIDDKIFLLGTVQGLTSERKKIKKAFNSVKPDAVALPISEEELEGLKKMSDGEKQEILLSGYEEVYAKKLAAHGEVQVPPPALTEAFELSKENSIPVHAIDMNDKEYTDAFTKNVSTIQLILHSLKIKKLRKKKF